MIIFKVYKYRFAHLLNIVCIEVVLFHKQGNFTRHRFLLMTEIAATQELNATRLQDVDYRAVILIHHKEMIFNISSTEDTIF